MSQLAKQSQVGSKYTDDVRHQAISHYITLGNLQKVAELTNIPRRTLTDWKNSEWWETELTRVRAEKSEELDAVYTQAIHAAQKQILDRIESGDYILDKNNQLIRKPMIGKDLAMVGAIQFDKRQIMRNLPTSISAGADNKALEDLKARFEALTNKETKVIDGSCKDVTD